MSMGPLRPVPRLSILLASLLIAQSASAQESSKPLLSDEIREALEAGGADAARTRFNEIFPDQEDRYQVDLEGIYALAAEKMMGGEVEAAEVLMEIVATLSQAQAAAYVPEIGAAAGAQEKASDERSDDTGTTSRVSGPGPARSDLRRFRGQYGQSAQDPPRNLFVMETCDGYLVAGPMWADVSSWHLRSVGANAFEYEDSFLAFSMTIDTAADGSPLSLSHTLEAVPSPLPYLGPLPAEWGDECMTVQRGR